MTLLRRGSAALLALLLILDLSLFPLRARAMSSALVAVGGATVIAATLAACGIYPYASAGEGSFGEWGARALTDLLQKYNEAHIESAIRMEQVRAYVVGRTLAVGREVWDRLRDFAAWVRDTYALTDNQTGLKVGVTRRGFMAPVFSTKPSDWHFSKYGIPFRVYTPAYGGHYCVLLTGSAHTGFGIVEDYQGKEVMMFVTDAGTDARMYNQTINRDGSINGSVGTFVWYNLTRIDGYYCYIEYPSSNPDVVGIPSASSVPSSTDFDIPRFATFQELVDYYFSGQPLFSGITADTTTVSVPAALPAEDDSEFVGLSVYPGTVSGVTDTPATVMTPEKVQEIIQQGVMSRERPVVTPVEVEVAAGTDVDAETGVVAVTDSGVTIDAQELEEQYVPAVSELAVPQAFLDSLAATMRTKFPFCLPFDAMRILQAFAKEPETPVFSLSVHDPFTGADYAFVVDLSPWNDVAAMVRQLEAIAFFVVFFLNFDKFNVLNIILGNLS